VSCAIEILSFQNFYEVLKTCSAGRKDFFDTLRAGQKFSVRPCLLRSLLRRFRQIHNAVIVPQDGALSNSGIVKNRGLW